MAIYYALDAKQPVLNGRGKDIRQLYRFTYKKGSQHHEMKIIACCLLDAYEVFDLKTEEIHLATVKVVSSNLLGSPVAIQPTQ